MGTASAGKEEERELVVLRGQRGSGFKGVGGPKAGVFRSCDSGVCPIVD